MCQAKSRLDCRPRQTRHSQQPRGATAPSEHLGVHPMWGAGPRGALGPALPAQMLCGWTWQPQALVTPSRLPQVGAGIKVTPHRCRWEAPVGPPVCAPTAQACPGPGGVQLEALNPLLLGDSPGGPRGT